MNKIKTVNTVFVQYFDQWYQVYERCGVLYDGLTGQPVDDLPAHDKIPQRVLEEALEKLRADMSGGKIDK